MGATAERPGLLAPPTVRELLVELAGRLGEAEGRELLAALLDQPRSWPALHLDAVIERSVRERVLAAAAKRVKGAPLAYCVGTAPFRHLVLDVDERVLIPRPETEQLVDVAMAFVGPMAGGVAVDAGTGSGAIALALATEGRFDRVIGVDVSLDALAVARRNVERLLDRLETPVELRHGSLLAPVSDVRPRLVVSNPPYIANEEAATLPSAVRDWEPPVALFSADDGLRTTARLLRQAGKRLLPGGALVLEVDSRRANTVAEMARREMCFRDVNVLRDLTGRDRFVVARRKEDG